MVDTTGGGAQNIRAPGPWLTPQWWGTEYQFFRTMVDTTGGGAQNIRHHNGGAQNINAPGPWLTPQVVGHRISELQDHG